MKRMVFKGFLMSAAVLVLAACATTAPAPSVSNACLQRFNDVDTRLEATGRHDAGAYRIPGFPYLRSTRFTASFSDELDSQQKLFVWVAALRAEDQKARAIELRNLSAADEELGVLADCGSRLVKELLDDANSIGRLQEVAQVPDDYSSTARVLGLYPFAVPVMRMAINRFHKEVRADYAGPLLSSGKLMTWQPATARTRTSRVTSYRRDALGVPQLSEKDRQSLLEQYAPHWEVEVESADDFAGRIVAGADGPEVDTTQAVTYTNVSYTRMGSEVLPQLVYSIWFPRRTAEASVDFYAGEFDAVTWRVTLGSDGQPVMYDSIHGCGCYHYFYPAKSLPLRQPDSLWSEPILVPQTDIGSGPVTLRLQAGRHYLRRVLPRNEGSAMSERRIYQMKPYATLLNLPLAEGSSSLFDNKGLLVGSSRLERLWLWPSGVISPGAMRQNGRHAVAFIGRRHFDDPGLFDEIFVVNP